MKCKRISSISLAVVMLGLLAANSAQATNWTVTQLTNNSYDDVLPQIYGSNVVWQGWDGSDWEIFLYDVNTGVTTQLTNNSYSDEFPQIYGSSVVWHGGATLAELEIFMARVTGDANGDGVVSCGRFHHRAGLLRQHRRTRYSWRCQL